MERVASFSPSTFASAWLNVVGEERTLVMAQDGGMFVVSALCERIREEGSEEEKTLFRGWFGKKVMKDIQKSTGRGKDVLLASLGAI